jgi:hypothetical protein
MIGLLAGMGSVQFPSLLTIMDSNVGLGGPIGLEYSTGGDSVGLGGGVGLEYDAGYGYLVGLNGGFGLFA